MINPMTANAKRTTRRGAKQKCQRCGIDYIADAKHPTLCTDCTPEIPDMRDLAGYTAQITALSESRNAIAKKRQARIVELKNKFNISYADMAKATGLSEAAISKIAYAGGVPRRQRTPE